VKVSAEDISELRMGIAGKRDREKFSAIVLELLALRKVADAAGKRRMELALRGGTLFTPAESELLHALEEAGR
jgi:hypothetical protein